MSDDDEQFPVPTEELNPGDVVNLYLSSGVMIAATFVQMRDAFIEVSDPMRMNRMIGADGTSRYLLEPYLVSTDVRVVLIPLMQIVTFLPRVDERAQESYHTVAKMFREYYEEDIRRYKEEKENPSFSYTEAPGSANDIIGPGNGTVEVTSPGPANNVVSITGKDPNANTIH